jgi:hypothetical protein
MPDHRFPLLTILDDLGRITAAAQLALDDPQCGPLRDRIEEIREAAARIAGTIGAMLEDGDSSSGETSPKS